MIERKCTSCGTWNKAEDYCTNCNSPLSQKAVEKAREQKRKEEEASKPPSKIDVYLEKAKNSKYGIVRAGYYVLYSIGMIIGAFGAFMAWLVAMANG